MEDTLESHGLLWIETRPDWNPICKWTWHFLANELKILSSNLKGTKHLGHLWCCKPLVPLVGQKTHAFHETLTRLVIAENTLSLFFYFVGEEFRLRIQNTSQWIMIFSYFPIVCSDIYQVCCFDGSHISTYSKCASILERYETFSLLFLGEEFRLMLLACHKKSYLTKSRS